VECGVWSVTCEVWSVKCEVWSVKSAVRSVKCEVELQMWHVKRDTTFAECTRARTWLAHGACKFYRWERSYSISLRQLPPRLVRILPTVYWGIRINQPIWRGHTGFCTLFTWISWPRAHSDRDSWKFVEQILCTLQEGEKLTALAQPKATAMEA
jgi:hypothetical protein